MKISIITAVRNDAEHIEETIRSVLDQDYPEIEYIIIDGVSTDGTTEIISRYRDRLKAFVSEPDTGIYNAMNKGIEIALGRRVVNAFNRSELVEDKNKGIKMASGEYLLFLNSGDRLVNNNVLQNVIDENFTEDIIYGKQMIEKDGALTPGKFYSPEEMSFCAFLKSTLPHQCTFIRVALFDKIGMYNEQNKIVSDWEWNLVALFRWNVSLREIDVPISVYDTKGISSNQKMYELQQQERLTAAMRHFPRMMMDVDVWKRFQQSKSYKLVMWLKKWK